jgi:hypothetical protein
MGERPTRSLLSKNGYVSDADLLKKKNGYVSDADLLKTLEVNDDCIPSIIQEAGGRDYTQLCDSDLEKEKKIIQTRHSLVNMSTNHFPVHWYEKRS